MIASSRSVRFGAALALAALLPLPARSEVVPEAVPDLPVLGAPAPMGALSLTQAGSAPLSPKAVDGDVSDWHGEPSRLGGTAYVSRGEWIHQDYVMDDRGADDGQDAARTAISHPLYAAEPRTFRVEALSQAAGEQFGAPGGETIAAEANYGDVERGAHGDQADIQEVRAASDARTLWVLVRLVGLTDARKAAVVALIDTAPGGSSGVAGLTSEAEHALIVTSAGVAGCGACTSAIDIGPPGDVYRNAIEFSVPLAEIGDPAAFGLVVATGVHDGAGGIARLRPGDAASDLIDVTQVESRASIWMDHDQAHALHEGSIDRWSQRIDVGALASGLDQSFRPRPGYYERIYESRSPVNREVEENSYFQGAFQHYGVYLPSAYRPGRSLPATWWTHYRGGHAHDAAAWVPGLVRQLGEQQGNIVITPGARGTSSWYVGRGHEDFLEVWDDSMASFPIDPDRVYMSGYSMGGFASWLLGFVYPDRFAGAFPTAGPPTQGLWLGRGTPPQSPQQGGDVNAELTYEILGNARNLPYVIYHGTNDELVPYSGIVSMAARFQELGYRWRLYTFPGAEHYTNAIYDEWTEAARYLNAHRRGADPPRVTYTSWPALERAVERVSTPPGVTLDYRFDGAYWVDGIRLRADAGDLASRATVDATTFGNGLDEVVTVPEASTGGQIVPHVMTGGRWHVTGRIAPRNAFEATLTNVGEVRFDLPRMGIGAAEGIEATFTSDGPATIELRAPWGGAPVVTGAPSTVVPGGVRISVGSGITVVTIAP